MNQEKIVELQKQNNMYAKCLLLLEWVIGIISSITFFILIFVTSYIDMSMIVRVVLIIIWISINLITMQSFSI